jgi:hypothetical protein
MPFPVNLTLGDHEVLSQVLHWDAEWIDVFPPQVRLLASIESPPRQTTAQSLGATATSLAMAMDARTAIRLYERLGDLIREMRWQQYVSDGCPI